MGIIEAIRMITFEEGIEKGEQIKTYEVTKNLLLDSDFEISKIATLTNSSESFVEKIWEDLEHKE